MAKKQLIRITYPNGDGELHISAEVVHEAAKRVGQWVAYEFKLALRPNETVLEGLQRAARDILK